MLRRERDNSDSLHETIDILKRTFRRHDFSTFFTEYCNEWDDLKRERNKDEITVIPPQEEVSIKMEPDKRREGEAHSS